MMSCSVGSLQVRREVENQCRMIAPDELARENKCQIRGMAPGPDRSSVNHVVCMCTYFVRISKMGDIFDQKYYPIRAFAHCTYPVRMYVCVRIVSICTYLHVSIYVFEKYIHILSYTCNTYM